MTAYDYDLFVIGVGSGGGSRGENERAVWRTRGNG